MSYRRHDLSALIVTDARAAAKVVLEAYRRARCSRKEAARLLGCSRAGTWGRWVQRLDRAGTGVTAAMRRMKRAAKAEGWHNRANATRGAAAESVNDG
jgi:hypothetical protein